jgi:hypothetical protein
MLVSVLQMSGSTAAASCFGEATALDFATRPRTWEVSQPPFLLIGASLRPYALLCTVNLGCLTPHLEALELQPELLKPRESFHGDDLCATRRTVHGN